MPSLNFPWFFFLCLALVSCQSKPDNQKNTLAAISDTKILQYAIPGKKLYETHCANCHREDGKGLGKLIPPLNPSDYMAEDITRTIKIIKYGLEGPIMVNGISYDGKMPTNPTLTNMEIAQITTYIYNIWGNDEGLIDASQVGKVLQE